MFEIHFKEFIQKELRVAGWGLGTGRNGFIGGLLRLNLHDALNGIVKMRGLRVFEWGMPRMDGGRGATGMGLGNRNRVEVLEWFYRTTPPSWSSFVTQPLQQPLVGGVGGGRAALTMEGIASPERKRSHPTSRLHLFSFRCAPLHTANCLISEGQTFLQDIPP